MALKLEILETPEAVAECACAIFADALRENPASVLGLATGATPIPLYERLVGGCERGEISFADVSTFNLDEYVGLPASHPNSYRRFMDEHLFGHVDITRENIHFPMVENNALDEIGPAYDAQIHAYGGIDLQLLGLGRNGHIGFNEPGTRFNDGSGPRRLANQTRSDNQRFFSDGEEVPQLAISMGIKTILSARSIVLLAVGEAKAQALRSLFEDAVSVENPASALNCHSNVRVFADVAAASLLTTKQPGTLELACD